jgi:hypothetical protein
MLPVTSCPSHCQLTKQLLCPCTRCCKQLLPLGARLSQHSSSSLGAGRPILHIQCPTTQTWHHTDLAPSLSTHTAVLLCMHVPPACTHHPLLPPALLCLPRQWPGGRGLGPSGTAAGERRGGGQAGSTPAASSTPAQQQLSRTIADRQQTSSSQLRETRQTWLGAHNSRPAAADPSSSNRGAAKQGRCQQQTKPRCSSGAQLRCSTPAL